jgi:glycosyltransferase involved in cell wall biosynthesis
LDRSWARNKLGLSQEAKLVLFAAAMRPEKRFELVKESFDIVKRELPDAELIVLTNQPPELVPVYMNACDVLVLASQKEGSPQVVKEALACNLPVVSTNVGDIEQLIGSIPGCHLVQPEAADIAEKLVTVLRTGERIAGRESMHSLSLDAIAVRLMDSYGDVLITRTS